MFRLPALFRVAATPKPAAPASIARFWLRSEGKATTTASRANNNNNDDDHNVPFLHAQTAPEEVSSQPLAPKFKSTTVAPTTQPHLPYFVMRTGSAKLPVYSETKAGGTLKQTKLRKISGDVRALKRALQTELGLDPSEVKINDLTQQILVKGDRKMEIQTWLIAKGF